MTNLLVTGGLGFIGSEFVRQVANSEVYSNIVVLDAITYAANLDSLDSVSPKTPISIVKGSICDEDLVRSLVRDVDVIVNFAAESHVDTSIRNVEPFLDSNVRGVVNLLEASKDARISRFLQVSTDEVYGSNEFTLSKEADLISPRNPYSASKAAAENFCLAFANTFALDVVITRSSNNYGPFQQFEKFIPNSINALLKGENIKIYGDGLHEREWIHVTDNCLAIALVLEKGKPSEIYNIGTNFRKRNLEIAKMLIEISEFKEEGVEFVEDRLGHDRRYAIDSSKIRKELGWAPQIEFSKGLEQTFNWYKNRIGEK
jgi:dTDP-glucose 4,6-dehydratase